MKRLEGSNLNCLMNKFEYYVFLGYNSIPRYFQRPSEKLGVMNVPDIAVLPFS